MLAEILARVEGAHQDHAFTAGVLHDLGLLALDQNRPDGLREAIRMARDQQVPLQEAQRRVLGFTDAELGGALALHWNFPPALAEAIKHHAMPLDRLPERRSLAGFVVRARIFARFHGLSNGIERFDVAAPPPEWDVPPLSVSLRRRGGMEGVLEQLDAFLEAARA
jgi:HD-like signal output (HDOD) protein